MTGQVNSPSLVHLAESPRSPGPSLPETAAHALERARRAAERPDPPARPIPEERGRPLGDKGKKDKNKAEKQKKKQKQRDERKKKDKQPTGPS